MSWPLYVCPSVNRLTQNFVDEFRWSVGCVTSNSWLDFGSDADKDANTGMILNAILPLRVRAILQSLLISCRWILIKFLRGHIFGIVYCFRVFVNSANVILVTRVIYIWHSLYSVAVQYASKCFLCVTIKIYLLKIYLSIYTSQLQTTFAFGVDPDHNADAGIFDGIFHHWEIKARIGRPTPVHK